MDYDAELRLLNEVFRGAWAIERHNHVLDIGCGAGQTTREAARQASDGVALGVDLSAAAIARARELAGVEGIGNVMFEHADAEVHPFASEAFDVAISRFGTMFFHNPVAAFANIGRALRRGGRLVMMVWQGRNQNEWWLAIDEALGGSFDVPASEASDPFSLADRAEVVAILDKAGFSDLAFTDVHRPIYYGPDVAAALRWVRGFTCTRSVLASLGAGSVEPALARLQAMLARHLAGDGVWFDAQAWIVRAVRQ